jgi:hypothetical protein
MPIQHAIWRVGENPVQLASGRLPSEKTLEDMIQRDSRILSSEWMLIGRQEYTSYGGCIDLLAIAPDGSLVLIELKRDRTPREVIAQALDYATERIIGYLNERDIAINIMFFQVFEFGGEQLLSRAWLIDPGETQGNVATTARNIGEREPWNGEYYVSFGEFDSRSWEDARQYGYISAGGGRWYSQTLRLLKPGDRVWVNIPQIGYVGVGRVTESVCPVDEFMVPTPLGERPALDVLKHADHYRQNLDDPEKREYFVRIAWLDTVPKSKAVYEVGLFGNQNTVRQPTAPKWRHTVERLKTYFLKWDEMGE